MKHLLFDAISVLDAATLALDVATLAHDAVTSVLNMAPSALNATIIKNIYTYFLILKCALLNCGANQYDVIETTNTQSWIIWVLGQF